MAPIPSGRLGWGLLLPLVPYRWPSPCVGGGWRVGVQSRSCCLPSLALHMRESVLLSDAINYWNTELFGVVWHEHHIQRVHFSRLFLGLENVDGFFVLRIHIFPVFIILFYLNHGLLLSGMIQYFFCKIWCFLEAFRCLEVKEFTWGGTVEPGWVVTDQEEVALVWGMSQRVLLPSTT